MAGQTSKDVAGINNQAKQDAAARVAARGGPGDVNDLLAHEPDVAARQVDARVVGHHRELIAGSRQFSEVVLAPPPPTERPGKPGRSSRAENLTRRERRSRLPQEGEESGVSVGTDLVVPLHAVESACLRQPRRFSHHIPPNLWTSQVHFALAASFFDDVCIVGLDVRQMTDAKVEKSHYRDK